VQPYVLHLAFRGTVVTPAFDGVHRWAPLGVRLEGRTGNLPSSGLSPDQFTAGSEAAQ
jgi:hypothetical protein